jgi:glutamine cyclotransferase
LISPAQTITGQKTFSSEVLLNSISSIDSTAVQINDGLTVSGALTANTIQTNNISSSESSAIQVDDGMNVSGTLTANTFVTNNISSSESSAIQINDGVNISGSLTANTIVTNDISSADSTAVQINDAVNVSGTLTANTFVTNNISSSESSAIQINDSVNVGGTLTAASIAIDGKQAVNGPAFSAYANSSTQTITNGSQQKVLFQTEEFDTNSNFASSTFTPTVAGYYQLNAEVRLDGASGTGEMMIVIWKNGAEYKRGTNQQGTQIAANFWAMQVSSVVYANGTGDYFEIYVQQGSGGSVTVTAVNVPYITWFNGCMIRGA